MNPTVNTARDVREQLDLPYMHQRDHFIDGAYVASTGDRSIDVVDPVTEEVWASVPDASSEDLDRAVVAAEAAFPAWAELTARERASVLLRAADEIEARREPLGYTNTRENGSPVSEMMRAASNAAGIFRYFAGLADWLDREDVRPFPNGVGETSVHKDPVGVCALIAPWNFPINLVVAKLAPALLAGCTAVIKPASPTPLSVRFIADALTAAGVPNGVVNVVTRSGRMGDQLVRHPGVRKVAFTGSTPVGRKIAAACGENLKPVTLELGGKSSAIVLDDADLDHMSSVLIRSCMRNTGQTCYISTRILAPESRYREVVDMVARTVGEAPQGDSLDDATVFGPMANRAQFETVMGFLASAREEGATIITGGDRADRESGFFIQPTVLADVTPDMTVARDEIFGPVVTILRYKDVDHALELANNTPFGLGGIVFSSDEDRARHVARRMDTGSVGINFFASNHSAPFGGRGDSGLGVEFGVEGLSAYLTPQSVHRQVHH